MEINNALGFKSFDRTVKQTKFPDSRYMKADILFAIEEARKAQNVFSDKLYILENLLNAATEEE